MKYRYIDRVYRNKKQMIIQTLFIYIIKKNKRKKKHEPICFTNKRSVRKNFHQITLKKIASKHKQINNEKYTTGENILKIGCINEKKEKKKTNNRCKIKHTIFSLWLTRTVLTVT